MRMEFLLWPMIFLLLGVLVTLCTLQLLVYLDGTRPKHRRSIFAPKRPKYEPKHAVGSYSRPMIEYGYPKAMQPLKCGWKGGLRQGKQMLDNGK